MSDAALLKENVPMYIEYESGDEFTKSAWYAAKVSDPLEWWSSWMFYVR